jgi:hypothetical protein
MAKNKRKVRAAKSAVVILLVGATGAEECFGRDKLKHIELRQHEQDPGLVGQAWNIANASTATITTVSPFIIPDQFTYLGGSGPWENFRMDEKNELPKEPAFDPEPPKPEPTPAKPSRYTGPRKWNRGPRVSRRNGRRK